MIDVILTALGLSKGATIGGFVGAIVSLKFIEGLNIIGGAFTVFCGTCFASFVTPLVLAFLDVSVKQELGVAFLIGVFGMLFGASIAKEIPPLITALKDKVIK